MTPYTKDIIEARVAAMKSSGTITSISNVGTLYTIMTTDTGNLVNSFKVKIGTNYLRVSSVTWNSFKVTSSVDLSEETNWEMYINFLFGSKEETVAKMTNYPGTKANQKFDIIWLLNIIEGDLPDASELIDRVDNTTIAIVKESKRNYTSEERDTYSFEAVLDPLYELFIKELKKSNELIVNRGENLDVKRQKHYLYNSQKEANVFNEATDAIELIAILNIKKVFENENMK